MVNSVPHSPLVFHRESGTVRMERQSDDRGRMKESGEL